MQAKNNFRDKITIKSKKIKSELKNISPIKQQESEDQMPTFHIQNFINKQTLLSQKDVAEVGTNDYVASSPKSSFIENCQDHANYTKYPKST
jgi:hypothetical protein